jgi:hypothetical protein
MIQHHPISEFAVRTLATAARLVTEARSSGPLANAKIMSFAIHPYIMGVPHRISLLEDLLDQLMTNEDVVFMQGHALMDWYLATGSDV